MDAAAQRRGFDLWQLMQRAGQALAESAQSLNGELPILICCGGGNNGGDGWVAAECLHRGGHSVAVWPLQEPRSALCQAAAKSAQGSGLGLVNGPEGKTWGLIVDAILGAGQRPQLSPELDAALDRLSRCGAPILACDLATGPLKPQHILAMQVGKQENPPQIERIADLGIPPACWLEVDGHCLADLPRHRRQSHKGNNGRLLAIGGGPFPGALSLASQSAMRAGCDLVFAWTTRSCPLPETIIPLYQEGPQLAPCPDSSLAERIAGVDAVLIGPGMGNSASAQAAARQALELAMAARRPCLIDADGIAACAPLLRQYNHPSAPIILTPHAKEAASLLGQEAPTWVDLHAWAGPKRVILAKGPVDLISDGRQWQRHHGGNPRLSVGGSGDCLAGLCSGLLARGCPPFAAARLACYWLCACADQLWQEQGPCYDPRDLIQNLGPSLKNLFTTWQAQAWPPISD